MHNMKMNFDNIANNSKISWNPNTNEKDNAP